MGLKFPIDRRFEKRGPQGERYVGHIKIEQTNDPKKYPPDGTKMTANLLRINDDGENELMVLVDNHEPYGFHCHDKLPKKHDSRQEINVDKWQDAWKFFQTKCKEFFQ